MRDYEIDSLHEKYIYPNVTFQFETFLKKFLKEFFNFLKKLKGGEK